MRLTLGAKGFAATWTLSCGHEIPLLEHERPDDRPRQPKMLRHMRPRPTMCPVCQKMRNVEIDE
jgi:hypothetical protein